MHKIILKKLRQVKENNSKLCETSSKLKKRYLKDVMDIIVFIVYFEEISHIALSFVDFEQTSARWE